MDQLATSATAAKIKAAFSALMEEQSFSSIRVTSIVQRANISHQSFYRCFQNKYDLAVSFFSQQMNSCLLFCGKNATVRDLMFAILTIIRNNAKLYTNLLRDEEGAKLLPAILERLSSGWTGFEPAWATTVINTNILINWANTKFAAQIEDIYSRFISSLPAYELLTEDELKSYIERYESLKGSDFLSRHHKKVHK